MKIIPAIFEEREIRRVYDEKAQTWFFSVVDIIQVLTQQPDYQTARKYWNKLKQRLGREGSQLVTNCHQLKMAAGDGKQHLTDVANAETLLRLVQSVPSPKAEPIKLGLPAPANTLERARQRRFEGLLSLPKPRQGRNLCSFRRPIGIPSSVGAASWWETFGRCRSYGAGNNCLATGATNISSRPGLKTPELIFTALAELSTRQIAESVEATGMAENGDAARTGGKLAKRAPLELEARPGEKMVTGENYLPLGGTKKVLKASGTT